MNALALETRLRRVCFWIAVVTLGMSGHAAATCAPGPAPDMNPAVIDPDLPIDTPPRSDLDAYGGWLKLKGKSTGFFHLERLGGRWWLVTPTGHVFFMLAMVSAGKRAVPRIRSWGFNTAEPGSGMPYTLLLRFFRLKTSPFPVHPRASSPPRTSFPDVFDPAWPRECRDLAQRELAPRANDPLMIGYFLDNEICFEDWYGAVFRSPKDAPCRIAFANVAQKYYADAPGSFARDWKKTGITRLADVRNYAGVPPHVPALIEAWKAAVAERAFSVPAGAARAAAPHHLDLGTRLYDAPLPSAGILAAMGKYCDAISLNFYNIWPDRLMTQMFTFIPAIYKLTGRPTLTTEFSFRGGDTRLPNTVGAPPTVKTQADRAIGYLSYVAAIASIPSHVGITWYKYGDDHAHISWKHYDEDCNFGAVDRQNRPYAVLTQTMRVTNSVIYEIAADPAPSPFCPLFWRTELARWDVPGDAILLQRMMQSATPFVDPLAKLLPAPRRYDAHYWIRHRSPHLIINDDRFSGSCEANLIQHDPHGMTVVFLDIQSMTSFPRRLWLGPQCPNPDAPLALESNAQFLSRQLDRAGRLVRMTMADGSFLRTGFTHMELHVEEKIPYLDLRFNPDAQELAITVRGNPTRIGLANVRGWRATWNGVSPHVSELGGLTVYTAPQGISRGIPH